MSDDPLNGLLRSVRRQGKRDDDTPGSPQPEPEDVERGLNPLDLLALPPAQRDLINWLSRRKQATFGELQDALHLDAEQLSAVLAEMKEAGYVNEALIGSDIYYRVVFRGKISRAARDLPESIWSRIDIDNRVFLKQIPLFSKLADDDIREIASKLDHRRYHRNEVILWQGGLGEGIYFIKSGIVGISRLSPHTQSAQTLAYLQEGDLLGEYSLLSEQNAVASATASALSEVDVLLMKRDDFLALLDRHPQIAVELARLLVQRLVSTNQRVGSSDEDIALSLVIGVVPGTGCTTLGTSLAAIMAQTTGRPTAYTEHPRPNRLPALFGFGRMVEIYDHPAGYDVFVPHGVSILPPSVRTTLITDRLVSNYSNIVVGVSGKIDETVIYLLEQADQVVLVVPPEHRAWVAFEALLPQIKAAIHPEKTGVLVVGNRPDKKYHRGTPLGRVDFDIPYMDDLPPLSDCTAHPPAPLADVCTVLADRLGRTNQIGVYIPTTVDVKQLLDTSAYVDETLEFLGRLFGGATSNPAQGVWNSDQVGLVSETIYIVRTYVTKSDIDRHLGDVLEFVERLKNELNQEAMALEVNQKLMLI